MNRFDGQIAVITGASRGLGFHLARGLCNEGAHVYAVARTVGGLEELDDLVRADGGQRPTLIPLDITDEEGVERLGSVLFERHKRLDVFVHAAIHAPPLSPVGHIGLKDLEKSLAVNAQAAARLIRSLDPLLMQSAKSRAMFFDDPKDTAPFWSSYAAAKEAGLTFARSWAAEREKTKLRVLFYEPPPMQTALRARFYPGEDQAQLAHPAEIASKIVEHLV